MSSVDKDRPSTWRKYEKDFCTQCKAHCCAMPVEVKVSDLIRLKLLSQDEVDHSLKKSVKRLKKEGFLQSYRESTELFMLQQKSNSDCIFQDSLTRGCTVYDIRPETCRSFPDKMGARVGYCPSIRK